MDTIKLTINGKQIEANKGMTVLEAAESAGIYIPTLCADPDLAPYGGCRLCIVEIENMRGLPPACTTPAADGMVVNTDTSQVNRVRRTVMELLIADHPADCLNCAANQRCELQRVAAHLDVEELPFRRTEREFDIDDSNPFFYLDRNKCVLCTRCTRTCEEITGVGAIELAYRGYQAQVSTFGAVPLMESICRSCGECVAHCPVGALMPKETARPTQEVLTTCPYCGVGCGMYIGVREGKIISVRGERDNPASKGRLCVKGRFGIAEFVHHLERLTTPLVRKDGELKEASWDEALNLVAEKLSGYSDDELAVFSSAKCTNEDNYVVQKFARAGLGTNNVDHCARLCHAPSVAGLVQSFGSGAMTNAISEIAEAGCLFAIGTNTTSAHPVIGFEVKAAVRGGTKLIVANPREINLCRHADIWLRQNPGTDVPLLMGMARVIVDEGLMDEAFLKERCEGFDEFKASLSDFDLDTVQKITGVPKEDIARAARLYAAERPSSILYSMGITQHSHGTDNVIATANLAMLTGNVGRCSSGVNPLRGQNNVQGACDLGALPNVYPGYQAVGNEALREKFEKAWDAKLSPLPGLTVTEVIPSIGEGKIKALYIVGENPALSDPDAAHAQELISQLDFLVVQDIFLTETAQLADVVLPGASFAEKDGTFTNTERRVQRVRKVIEPLGDSKADWWITCQIAQRMGKKGFEFETPAAIMAEIAEVTPSYGGISYERLDEVGLQWPCPTCDHPGTPFLHSNFFTRGKGRLITLTYKPPKELPDEDYPLLLTTGRSLFHWHTGTMTRKVGGLNAFMGEELVEMNPADAAELGLSDGDKAKVASRRGEVTARVKLTEVSPPGVVFMTFHFGESSGNVLTNPVLDPVAKIPEFKVCAVRVKKA